MSKLSLMLYDEVRGVFKSGVGDLIRGDRNEAGAGAQGKV